MSERKAAIHFTSELGDQLVIPLDAVNYLAIPCSCGRLHRVSLAIQEEKLPELPELEP